MKTYKTVTLVGMMGAGKTSIAKKLSKKLGVKHIDTDREVKLRTGISVKDFIEQKKQNDLNLIEYEIIKEFVGQPCVISTGDYTVNNQKAWDFIMNHTVTIWINAHLNQVFNRLRPTENRPFLEESTNISNLYELLNQRKNRYKLAKIHIKSINLSKIEEVSKIVAYYSKDVIIL